MVTCVVLGNEKLNELFLHKFKELSIRLINGEKKADNIARTAICVLCIGVMLIKPVEYIVDRIDEKDFVLSEEQETAIDDAIKLSYVEDLILLKDQVTSAYNEETGLYDFDKMFEYAAPYIKDADLAFNVFEGPTAGGEEICAMTEEEYVVNINQLVETIKTSNPKAEIVLLSPWTTLEIDAVSKLEHNTKK